MSEITVEQSFELLTDTLLRLDEKKLSLDDRALAYEIFEELDSDHHTYLHEWTVDRLINAGKIPLSVRTKILQLRSDIGTFMKNTNNIEFYRNDWDWKLIRDDARKIVSEIRNYRP